MDQKGFGNTLRYLIAVLIALAILRSFSPFNLTAVADSSRFEHIHIVSPVFLYKGQQGLLVLDKRNGNVWFIGRHNSELTLNYDNPVFVTKIPFDKLDSSPN